MTQLILANVITIIVVITTAQLRPTKLEFGICAGSNPVCSVLEICGGEDL